MVEPRNPYEGSNRDTFRQIATMAGCMGSIASCLTGIWIGLGNECDDWTPSIDRIFFVAFIAAIPFIIPFSMNLIAIPLLYREQNRQFGIGLLISSCLIALLLGLIAARMGRF